MPPRPRKTPDSPTAPRTRTPRVSRPAVADPQAKYAATTWGSSGLGGTVDLECPSGQTCLVRRPGMEGLIKEGLLRNLDSLTAIVDQKHVSKNRSGGKAAATIDDVDVKSLMQDPAKLDEIMHTVDRVLSACVVLPKIEMAPGDVTRRVNGTIYTDMIELNDKMFIFNFIVGGSADLASFRGQLSAVVGNLASS